MTPISIFLSDPQTLFRQGLRALLADSPFLQIVGDASSLPDLSDSLLADVPGVVLLESIPGKASSSLVQTSRKLWPQAKVAFLTAYEDGSTLAEYAQSEAAGVILKESSLAEFRMAVQTIHQGGTFVSARVFPLWSRIQAEKSSTPLTVREQEILRLTAQGHSVRQIAAMLCLSAKTVDAHKVNLMRKLHIHNKAHLVHYAFQNNILTLAATCRARVSHSLVSETRL